MKWIGQHIYDLIARFRHDVYLENIADGTVANDKFLGLDDNNKIVRETVTSSSGKLYSNGDNGKSTCIILSKKNKEKNNSNLEAFCETTDLKTGDKTFSYNIRNEGTVQAGSAGKGKQTIIGGTGKFKGISGVCNYTVKYLPENRLTTTGTCDYKI